MLKIVPVESIPKQVQPCPLEKLDYICLMMRDLCIQENGAGLSAVQVGLPWRLYLVKYGEDFRYFANCTYEKVDDEEVESLEGCLSLRKPDGSLRSFKVKRLKRVRVVGTELGLGPVDFVCEELEATIHQHEIDHERLVLISDIGIEVEKEES